jgi:hypothetical protein
MATFSEVAIVVFLAVLGVFGTSLASLTEGALDALLAPLLAFDPILCALVLGLDFEQRLRTWMYFHFKLISKVRFVFNRIANEEPPIGELLKNHGVSSFNIQTLPKGIYSTVRC